MKQQQVTSSQDVVKVPPTLDKIPEDVQLAIIKFIQSWKKSEGSEQEREKGKRARDSALRAMALSCRKLLSIYRPGLLSDVTLNDKSVLKLYLALARDHDSGKMVRSITFAYRDVETTQEEKNEARKNSPELNKALRDQGIKSNEVNIFTSIAEGVYRFLPYIQTLVIQNSCFNILLQSKLANNRLAPLPFLTRSLKKLSISLWEDPKSNLNARNVVWILVFCTGLRSAALGCVFDQNDFKYLVEWTDTFSGLSRVLKLSLGPNFTATESIRRYWDRGVGKEWIGGNKRTQAVFNLIKVTKNLQCLEINNQPLVPKEANRLNTSLSSALKGSYLSLESFRLFGVVVNQDDPEEFKANSDFSSFQKVKVMTLNTNLLVLLSRNSQFRFPPGLKILCIPYYNSQNIQEDIALARALKVKSLPSLEKIIIPSTRIFKSGTRGDSDDLKQLWLEGRRELEKAEIFQSGKVELRLIEPGESIGVSSETDFMSTLSRLSPP